jgi:menaquinone-dependent protoporphyrinogen IX oxidase
MTFDEYAKLTQRETYLRKELEFMDNTAKIYMVMGGKLDMAQFREEQNKLSKRVLVAQARVFRAAQELDPKELDKLDAP